MFAVQASKGSRFLAILPIADGFQSSAGRRIAAASFHRSNATGPTSLTSHIEELEQLNLSSIRASSCVSTSRGPLLTHIEDLDNLVPTRYSSTIYETLVALVPLRRSRCVRARGWQCRCRCRGMK